MALMARLAGRSCSNNFLSNEKNLLFLMRPVTIKATKVQPEAQTSFDERNVKLGRPYSPHMTIYAPQLTSLMSVTHRTSGILLSACTIGMGFGALLPYDGLLNIIDFIHGNGALLFLTKLGLALPFAYHFCNGARHLIWDLGKCLTLKEVYATGYAVLGASVLLGLFLAVL